MAANAAVPQRASMSSSLGSKVARASSAPEEIAQRGPTAGQRGVRLDPLVFFLGELRDGDGRRGVQVGCHGEERVLSCVARRRERGVQVGALDRGGAGQEVQIGQRKVIAGGFGAASRFIRDALGGGRVTTFLRGSRLLDANPQSALEVTAACEALAGKLEFRTASAWRPIARARRRGDDTARRDGHVGESVAVAELIAEA